MVPVVTACRNDGKFVVAVINRHDTRSPVSASNDRRNVSISWTCGYDGFGYLCQNAFDTVDHGCLRASPVNTSIVAWPAHPGVPRLPAYLYVCVCSNSFTMATEARPAGTPCPENAKPTPPRDPQFSSDPTRDSAETPGSRVC